MPHQTTCNINANNHDKNAHKIHKHIYLHIHIPAVSGASNTLTIYIHTYLHTYTCSWWGLQNLSHFRVSQICGSPAHELLEILQKYRACIYVLVLWMCVNIRYPWCVARLTAWDPAEMPSTYIYIYICYGIVNVYCLRSCLYSKRLCAFWYCVDLCARIKSTCVRCTCWCRLLMRKNTSL